MSAPLGLGIALVVLGGALMGSFLVPVRRMSLWRWENTWLLYSIVSMVIAPWAAAFAAVPHHLMGVYHDTGWSNLILIAVFGLSWGIGSVLFGLGAVRVGMGLAFAIILGITAAVGSLLPMAVLHPEQLHTRQGHTIIVGVALVILGTAFCGMAGQRREQEKSAGSSASSASRHGGFGLGLIICILSGIFSPMINFSFIFGQDLQRRSLSAGANFALSTYPIWSVALGAGFLANAGYCVYLLGKNRSWPVFHTSGASGTYWLGATLMGILWFGGLAAYGMGANALGGLGGVVGWPVFEAMNIITGNVWGAVSGEWAGASRRPRAYAWAGVGALLIAIYVISRGGV
jgi:L-rhamnose-H+ transport protein